MKTRSQSSVETLIETEIDFDEASLAWNKNKKKLGNGCYEYKKTAVYSKRRTVISNIHCYKCLNEGKKCNK
jgi:hypothetical protein